ncbi:MAG: hypothetical protein WBK91_04050 [Alphaproteobacteria bacterium]
MSLGRMMIAAADTTTVEVKRKRHKSLGRMMVGASGTTTVEVTRTRRKHDYYPTEVPATVAFMRAEEMRMPPKIWEPACGEGHMAKVIAQHGREVVASDLINRGYGVGGKNFLFATEARAPGIITNPPFSLAEMFIRKAMELRVEYLAMLLKSTYYHAGCRSGLYYRHRPSRKYDLTWRLDFTGEDCPVMECSWWVWDAQSPPGVTEHHLLHHPHAALAAPMPLLGGV